MEQLSAAEVAAKINSKSETFWMLSNSLDAHLPDEKYITIFFLRDLLTGKKKVSHGFYVRMGPPAVSL